MSVSGRSIFTKAFAPLLFEVGEIPSPADHPIAEVLAAMARHHAQNPVAAMIVEPLVQGAGGMKMYAPEKLTAMIEWCKSQGILVIFDEVMTGFYRTGTCFAADQLPLKPDIVCLSKGLTAGFLPMAVTACSAKIFEAFLSDDRSKMLFHGHSFTANPLGCAAANASLDIFEEENTLKQIARIVAQQGAAVQRFEGLKPITNVRQCGTILAMDWKGGSGYLQSKGGQIAQEMLKRDILLRPLGNVIYILPPYCTTANQLDHVYDQLEAVILELDRME
jgi:adenosylmethionine---8-amino-7-oxononanoate aminotransferase